MSHDFELKVADAHSRPPPKFLRIIRVSFCGPNFEKKCANLSSGAKNSSQLRITHAWGGDGHIRVTGRCVQRWVLYSPLPRAKRAHPRAPQAKILSILGLKMPFSNQIFACSTFQEGAE